MRYWCIRYWLDIEVLSHCLDKRQVEGWETVTKDTDLQGGKGNSAFPPPGYSRGNFDCGRLISISISSATQSLNLVWLFATPWTVARQASLSITNSRSLLKLMSIESVMPSDHLILCHPIFLLPSIFPSNRVFPSIRVLPGYRRGNSDCGRLITASKDIQVLILEPVNVTFSWQKKLCTCDRIKDLEMRRLSWISCVPAKSETVMMFFEDR